MSRPYNISDTLTFNPTGNTGATNMSISNAANGYHNSDWTSNYATVNVSSTTAGYIYFTFTVSDIPSNATITGITCSARERASNNNRISNASIQLYSNTTAKGSATTTSLSTTTTVYNITNANAGTWTVSELSNIRLRINAQRSGSNSVSIRFYGATLTVNYSVSGTEYEVSFSNTSSSTTSDPSTTQYVFQGGNQEITFYNINSLDDVEITDNSNNIENQLIHSTSSTKNLSFIPNELVDSNGTVTNTNNGLTDHTSTTYAEAYGQSTNFLMYKFNVPAIPSNATNISVSCTAKVEHTRTSSSSGQVQLYNGSTAKGSASSFGSTAATVNLTTGTWTASELSDVRIRIGNNYTGGTTTYRTRFYGATLTISYTIAEDVYTYTISNIAIDHSISITDALKMFIKLNGQYKRCNKIYKKINNVWTEVDYTTLTDPAVYIMK